MNLSNKYLVRGRVTRLLFAGEELHINLDTITTADVEAALNNTKPSAVTLKDKYLDWQKNYESV